MLDREVPERPIEQYVLLLEPCKPRTVPQ
jgi:hypothetical protein